MYNELDSIYENVYEYYVNDYIIFEGILRRDYYEVTGILNENAVTNFFKGIWEKILKAFKWLRDKIKELIDKLFKKGNKEDSSSEDNSEEETVIIKDKKMTVKEMIKKFDSYSKEDKDKLKDLKVSGFRYNGKRNINISDVLGDHIDMISTSTVTRNLDRYLQDEEEIQFYNKIINTNINEKLKEIKQSYYSIFSKEDIEYPFKDIDNNIIVRSITGKGLEYHKRNLIEYKNDADKAIKNIEYYINHIDERKEKVKDISQQQKNAALMLKAVNVSSRMTIGVFSMMINCDKMARKQCIKLYKTAINYLENNSSSNKEESQNESYISDEYNDILSEATLYELGL